MVAESIGQLGPSAGGERVRVLERGRCGQKRGPLRRGPRRLGEAATDRI